MRTIIAMLAAVSLCGAAEIKLGKPLARKQTVAIQELTAKPAQYAGKNVQVKGKIKEVCQNMGCWMLIADESGNAVRIKVKDGEIVFPKDAAGRTAVAEGKFVKIEMTREQAIAQAKHEAEENGRKFEPASITGPTTTYQIQGSGAVLLD